MLMMMMIIIYLRRYKNHRPVVPRFVDIRTPVLQTEYNYTKRIDGLKTTLSTPIYIYTFIHTDVVPLHNYNVSP